MKRVISFLTFAIIFSFIVSPLSAVETRLIWNLGDWEGLDVSIWAPWQAYPTDNITIRIRVEAKEDLQDVTVSLSIYSSMSEGYRLWLNRLDALTTVNMPLGAIEDQYFNVDIPESVDPGLIHALVACSWKVWRDSSWQERSVDEQCIHRVAYLRNKPYEDLQVEYDQLLANHTSLLSSYDQLLQEYNSLQTTYDDLQTNYNTLLVNYEEILTNYTDLQINHDSLNSTYHAVQGTLNELKSKYEFGGEMANTLNLMYVFIETTVIFIATTIYFAHNRIYAALQKKEPEQQT